jgi:hypothetical protein
VESLVLSGAPYAPILAKPGAFSVSQTFAPPYLPSIEVALSMPSNTGALGIQTFATGVPFFFRLFCLLSLYSDVVDSPCPS